MGWIMSARGYRVAELIIVACAAVQIVVMASGSLQ